MIFTKMKLYAAAGAFVVVAGMGTSIALLHMSNQAKDDKILLLGHEKQALIDQVEQAQVKLEAQRAVHMTYQDNVVKAQADITRLKRLLSEARKNEDTKTYEEVTNRSLSINLNCLHTLTQGGQASSCGPSEAPSGSSSARDESEGN